MKLELRKTCHISPSLTKVLKVYFYDTVKEDRIAARNVMHIAKQVQLGNDQEMAQSER